MSGSLPPPRKHEECEPQDSEHPFPETDAGDLRSNRNRRQCQGNTDTKYEVSHRHGQNAVICPSLTIGQLR
jgi:hypothetical protein